MKAIECNFKTDKLKWNLDFHY